MHQLKRQAVLRELLRRKQLKPNWLNPDFIKQNDFINSPARLKAVQCTRRAGKSYGAGLYLFKEAFETPGISVYYAALTRDTAKRIMFKDILKKIDKAQNIRASFNASELSVTLPNGSIIYLIGVDKDADQMDKLLGQKFKLLVIDEAAFMRQDVKRLVMEIAKPAVIDYRGTICMISTSSSLLNTFYHSVVTGKVKGWTTFNWTAHDNPYIAKEWKEEIEEMLAINPLVVETPMFKRMYLNQWVIDTDSIIYKYDETRNTQDIIPRDLKYVLGIDLGFNDATAFVVCAYSPHDPNLYIVETFKKSEMIIDDVANKIKELDKKYNFQTMVVDPSSKQVVETIKERYQLPLISADKTDKNGFIEFMNSDLIQGKIKLASKADALKEEWLNLIWDERKLKEDIYKEHASCENHLADAALYAWRWCYNYAWSNKPEKIDPNSEAAVDAHFDKIEADIMRARNPEEYVPYEDGETEWL